MDEILLAAATSADIFASVLGLRAAGIRLGVFSAAAVIITGSLILWASVRFSSLLCGLVPIKAALNISRLVLFALGVHTIFHEPSSADKCRKNVIPCSDILTSPSAADSDGSMTISASEGVRLGTALSADSFFTGLSAGMGGISSSKLLLFSLAAGALSCLLGMAMGYLLNSRLKPDFPAGRISGLLLVIIALRL